MGLSSIVLMVSCISDAPLEIECDIKEFSLHLDDPLDIFYRESEASHTFRPVETKYVFSVKPEAVLESYPVYINISKGSIAYIVVDGKEELFENGQHVDFSDECVQQFVVWSESREWSKTYEISMKHLSLTEVPEMQTSFDENYTIQGTSSSSPGYYVWTETDPVLKANLFREGDPTWKNGNPGYKRSRNTAQPEDYPTVPVVGGGMDGTDCIKMQTRSTGALGRLVKIYLAAGSIFNGEFDSQLALSQPLKATTFGVPCTQKPIRIEADLKYEPGPKFQDSKEKEVTGVVDEPDLYCVFYRNEDENGNAIVLDGADILTNKYIVGVARLNHHYNMIWNEDEQRHIPEPVITGSPIHGITSEWKHVSIPLNYDFFQTGHENIVDPVILKNRGYSLVIGATSSWRGGAFEGAIDSKLYMDNVKVVFKDVED